MLRASIVAGLITFLTTSPALAEPYRPTAGNLAARRWFQDAKFGLFVHWGVYSVPGGEHKGKPAPGGAEWIMESARSPSPSTSPSPRSSTRPEFDAAEWVRAGRSRRA